MTAADNVAYPLKMRRFDPQTIPDRVEKYLALVRLPGYGKRRIHELSGGQQQRVAIARALVFEPDLLLLDEPLAALDRKLREDMQLEFRRIQQELGVTTINVTHDQREALVMSDEIIVMESGRIEQNARPVDTYRHPASRFVAGFIGVTNFLAAVVKETAADGTVRLAVGTTELQARAPAALLSPGQSGGCCVARGADPPGAGKVRPGGPIPRLRSHRRRADFRRRPHRLWRALPGPRRYAVAPVRSRPAASPLACGGGRRFHRLERERSHDLSALDAAKKQ